MAESNNNIQDQVRKIYAQIAEGKKPSCCGTSSCCGGGESTINPQQLAQSVGYSNEEMTRLPDGANMGLSCGNPVAIAALCEGDVVLDLGCGGGFDVFIAGHKVGPTGRVIGVDMTQEMIVKARKNITTYREATGYENVEFRLGEIENLPLDNEEVDVIISNCVINLSTNKSQVWHEIARVLKPGGRVSVSDIALLKPLPEALKASIEAWAGCVAGAVLVEETKAMIQDTGLVDNQFNCVSGYIDLMAEGSDPVFRKLVEQLPQGDKPSDYVTSLSVTARKPA